VCALYTNNKTGRSTTRKTQREKELVEKELGGRKLLGELKYNKCQEVIKAYGQGTI
jgi:hypothetical protein